VAQMSKVKYLGVESFTNNLTGEQVQMGVVSKDLDILDKKGWRRVIMSDLMEVIEKVGNKKIEVLSYLIDNMDGKNQINTTYRQISKDTQIAIETIRQTFIALKEANLIKKIGGLYVLNVEIISSYGNSTNNKYLAIKYNFTNSKKIEKNKEQEIKELEIRLEKLRQDNKAS
jgi:Fe2+ or Zn2+ uptake regulation protein